jgi:DNA mismatch endonuclease (patch repair protein)
MPKTRSEYWIPKLERNKARDARNLEALCAAGWLVLVIWECEIGDSRLERTLRKFLL